MYRKCESRIQTWIDEDNKALLVYGARQVGKTYLIREMLERNSIKYAEYNLVERKDVLSFLESADSASEISERLALYSDIPLAEKESVIFLDEIQLYPDIITKIKFLVDEGKYRYILSGSNLGVELKNIKSVPVGYMTSLRMTPMDYEEFALASGITEKMLSHMRECFNKETPLDDVIHKKLLQAFYYYLVVGGMPAVINVFNESHSLVKIDEEQKNIINQYKADFTRYEAENKKLKVKAIYDNIPEQLNKQNRKFVFTMLNKELKFDRYEDSFLWLKDAAVAIPAHIVSEPKSPLKISRETNVFKLYLSDVGLLTSCYPLSVKKELLEMNQDNEINNGSLFENFVAEEIYTSKEDIYYFRRKNMGEVDFIIEFVNGVVPLEVKSGKDYKKHAALNHLMENHSFENVFVLSPNNLEKEGKITYLPIYMTGLLVSMDDSIDDQFIPAL